jgi:hypothetical protein
MKAMIHRKTTFLLIVLLTPISLKAQDSPEPKQWSVAGQDTEGAPELTEAADKAIAFPGVRQTWRGARSS